MKKGRKDGLFRRGTSPVWYCWVNGVRRSTGYTDVRAAQARKSELERLAADPLRMAAEIADLKGAIDDFYDYLETVEKKNPQTVRFYRLRCNALLKHFGEARSLASLGQASVWIAYIKERGQVVGSNTIGHELTAARRILRVAKLHKAFPFDLDEVFPPGFQRRYSPRTRALSTTEIEGLLRALDETSPRLAGYAAWAVATASRLSEVARAEARDVLDGGALVRVRGTKTPGAADVVPIAPAFREWVLWAAERGEKTGPLFGRWCNPSRDLAAACRRAGIPSCTANDLRRTHASLLRDAGVETRAIAAVLRHASPRMVEQVYAPTRGRQAADLVERASIPLSGPSKDSSPSVVAAADSQCPGPESNWRHEDFQPSGTGAIAAFPADSERSERGNRAAPAELATKDRSGFRVHARYRPLLARPVVVVSWSNVAGQGRVR